MPPMDQDPQVRSVADPMELVGRSMERLRRVRPVFYSEADFQHALAWDIHLAEPNARLRLETPLLAGGRERLDVLAHTGSGRYAIELKYPRAGFELPSTASRSRTDDKVRTPTMRLAAPLPKISAGLSG